MTLNCYKFEFFVEFRGFRRLNFVGKTAKQMEKTRIVSDKIVVY